MDQQQLLEKLKGMEYEDRAKYVNKVKESASENEHWLLLQLEIGDVKDGLYRHLLSLTDQNKMGLIAAQLQGVEMVGKLLTENWATQDKE